MGHTSSDGSMNIRKVAEMCEVSIATVSRVLHESARVSDATRAKVLNTIRLHGYLPNPLAQGLIKKRTWLIGVLVPDLYNQFVATVVESFTLVVEKARYQCIINATKNDFQKEHRAIAEALRYYCEAIVFVGTRLRADRNEGYIKDIGKRMPVIMINALQPIKNTYHIFNDECAAIESVVEYLVARGRKRLALIVGPTVQNTFWEKRRGFLKGLEKCQLVPNRSYILEGYKEYDDYQGAVDKLFRNKPAPDAIVTGGDLAALAVLKDLNKRHIAVPQDVMLVGYDNIPFAELSVPGLTTVDQQGALLGSRAAEILLNVLNGLEIAREHRFLPRIYQRETA